MKQLKIDYIKIILLNILWVIIFFNNNINKQLPFTKLQVGKNVN